MKTTLFEELQQRGLVDNITSPELPAKINQGGIKFYVGFDPTSDSLHVGQLALFNLMQILQQYGLTPIGLMGGATGMIGDPGGKSAERNLLTEEQIQHNINGIQKQLAKFLDFTTQNSTILINNYDWLGGFNYINFLRDIGKNFSVNQMITRDCVKSRLSRDGNGISYTEFSYILLQAYDFYYISQNFDCYMQIGGSDQWGNIVSGIDLSRRLGGEQLYGMTMPLITKADGTKFGKSEQGTIWLDPKKTSPYDFYQFFVRQNDEDVIHFLKVFTQVPLEEIKELENSVQNEPHLRKAQKRLAEEVTTTVHGANQLQKILQVTKVLYGEPITNLDDQMIKEIFKDAPSLQKTRATLEQNWSLIDALVETQACQSKSQARKLIEAGGVYINNCQCKNAALFLTKEYLASEQYMILRTGKKNYKLLCFS